MRPISHVCAVFVFAMFIIANIFLLAHGVRDVVGIALAAFCVLQLLGMFAAPRDRRQHRLGSVLLVLIAINALYDLALRPAYLLYTHAPDVKQTWGLVAGNVLASAAIFYLAYDFAFGEASRRFFSSSTAKK
ncbi:MAG TPA: hypothetical protein VG733_04175 [Chthoniobacteraceae bacterium]|nr:hypothetical protein [Chthoniobacteraceae bacterium]